MPNWLETLECARKDSGRWSLIIQDDMVALPGWLDHIEPATFYSPSPVLGLFHFGGFGQKALDKDAPYAQGDYLLWNGAVALQHDFLEGLSDWAHRAFEQTGYQHDDAMTSVYCRKKGLMTAITARSLFENPSDNSLLGHHPPIRRPVATILKPGPWYSVRPRVIKVARSGWDKHMTELMKVD